jgi:DNA-binding transcriptional MerR regulator|tara:strand:+ start:4145 stop:5128 length:984 start_codon:yes stop_codon:yes gene_type:complete
VEEGNLRHGSKIRFVCFPFDGSLTNPFRKMKERGVAQQFSIKDLEHFTGVKSHTIRAWEQRYELLIPKRTSTNIRYYSGDDLKKLLNVSYLMHHGMKISKIAQLSDSALLTKVNEIQLSEGGLSSMFSRLKLSMLNYDEAAFHEVVNEHSAQFGLDKTVLEVFLPFLSQIGVLWLTNSICPAQEHFISHLMRQVLNAAVDGVQDEIRSDAPVAILYLPEREIHDISLLFIHFLCRKYSIRSVFLGASVPFSDLLGVAEQFPNARFVAYCTTYPASSEAQAYVDMITSEFEGLENKFLLAGKVFEGCSSNEVVTTVTNGSELASVLFG